MQYSQRRLHLSVTDNRRFRNGRFRRSNNIDYTTDDKDTKDTTGRPYSFTTSDHIMQRIIPRLQPADAVQR